jgi:hypothetical protein
LGLLVSDDLVERLTLSPEQVVNLQRQKRESVVPHRRGEFLRGPVPMAWLLSASRLPGKALVVGVWLWFRAGIEKSTTIDFSATKLTRTLFSYVSTPFQAVPMLKAERQPCANASHGCRATGICGEHDSVPKPGLGAGHEPHVVSGLPRADA